jgi:lipoate-protein ligase A
MVSVDPGLTCAENSDADERLLRSEGPAARVGVLSDASVSFGVGVHEDAPYLLRARAAGVPVVRRGSGGTGVLHGAGDLVWSVVLPRTDPRVGRNFVRAYDRLGAGAVQFLAERDVQAEWSPPPRLVPDYCVLSGRGKVLTARTKVLGGAAQHLSRSALLHQGMIPLDVDRDLVVRLFDITDTEIMGRLVGLRDLGIEGGRLELARELASALEGILDTSKG